MDSTAFRSDWDDHEVGSNGVMIDDIPKGDDEVVIDVQMDDMWKETELQQNVTRKQNWLYAVQKNSNNSTDNGTHHKSNSRMSVMFVDNNNGMD
jgi:hypothetical protein